MKRIILLMLFMLCLGENWALDKYVVTTSSKNLNVRSLPSTESRIIGSLPNGTIIYVLNVQGNWAEFQYKDSHAYISAKYIKLVEKYEPQEIQEPQDTSIVSKDDEENISSQEIEKIKNKHAKLEYHTLYENNPNFWSRWGFDFIPSVYVGYGTFISSGSHTPTGICGWGFDANLQFYSKEFKVNYLAETSIGYAMKGNTGRPIHYFVFRVSPCGLIYELPHNIKLSTLLGIYIGASGTEWSVYTTRSDNFHAGVDAGAQLKVGLEYKNFGGYISYDQGFISAIPNLQMSLINTGINFHFYYRLWNLSENKIYTF